MATTFEWTLVILFVAFVYVISTIIIYYTIRFSKFRHIQAVQKRHTPLVYWWVFVALLYCAVSQPIFILSVILNPSTVTVKSLDSSNMSKDEYYGSILRVIAFTLYCFSIHAIIIILIVRSWIIYFNLNWKLQTQQSEWTIHINNDHTSNLWFVNHRNSFGSFKNIMIAALSYYFVEGLLLMFLNFFSSNIFIGIMDPFFFLVEIAMLTFLWFKIPPFYDVFAIKDELKRILIVGLIGLIIYVSWIISALSFGYNVPLLIIMDIFMSLIGGYMGWVLTAYLFTKKYKHLLSNTAPLLLTQSINKIAVDKQNHSIKNTLNDKQLIDEFFNHLSNEFSVELLLSFCEFQQFKLKMKNNDIFMNNIKDKIIEGDNRLVNKFILHEKIPPSYIIHMKHKDIRDHIEEYLLITQDLFNKYIKNGSEFEINVSYGVKMNISSFVNRFCIERNTLNVEEQYLLYSLFNTATHTVASLMEFSHQRFSNQFKS
eukprot:515315_1